MRDGETNVTFVDEGRFPNFRSTALMILASAAVGAVTGLLGVAFLHVLARGNEARLALLRILETWPPFTGWMFLCGLTSALAALAAWMVVRFSPKAAGSGIPYVETILRSGAEPDHRGVLPVKFIGGAIALASGLVLGREGPLVQMGAVVGEKIGRLVTPVAGAWRSLMTAGAGAGIATAFNAPVGGTLFVLEEVQRRITPLSFTLATTATVSAAFVQRAVFHMKRDYPFAPATHTPPDAVWIFLIFGAALGVAGVFYNSTLLFLSRNAARVRWLPAPARAAIVGAVIATAGWIQPTWIGGGDSLTASILTGGVTIGAGIVIARFLLGPLSYAAGTPGGLFAPIIALGALLGHNSAAVIHACAGWNLNPTTFVVAGMAGLFTATIRAPLTGIVICLEMTGAYDAFYPMLATCLAAFAIPSMMQNEPIYDALSKQRISSTG